MGAPSPLQAFNEYVEHIEADTLAADTFRAILCSASQALDPNFVGGSGNCTYADLTGELATGSGYTNGGVLLTSQAMTRSTTTTTWSFDPISWTLTGTINIRYMVIRNVTTGQLIAMTDLDTSLGAGVNVAVTAGTLQFNFATGGLKLVRA